MRRPCPGLRKPPTRAADMTTRYLRHTKVQFLILHLLIGAHLLSSAVAVTTSSTMPTKPNYKTAPHSLPQDSEMVVSLPDKTRSAKFSVLRFPKLTVCSEMEGKSSTCTVSHETLKTTRVAENLSSFPPHPYFTREDTSPQTESPTSLGQSESGNNSTTVSAAHRTLTYNDTQQNQLEILTVSHNERKFACSQ